jgi:hypothetical protein
MYWWNSSKLAEDFREGRVDERERFKYFLATFIGLTLFAHLFFTGFTFSLEDMISLALSLTVTIIGISICYIENKKAGNTDFIPRMICLGWPAGVQVTTMLVVAFLILSVIQGVDAAVIHQKAFLTGMYRGIRQIWSFFWGGFFLVFYYWWLYASFVKIAGTKPAEQNVTIKAPGRAVPEDRFTFKRQIKTDLEDILIFGKFVLGVIGGIGIAIFAIIMMMIGGTDPEISMRLRFLFQVSPLLLMLPLFWLNRRQKERAERRRVASGNSVQNHNS